MKRLILALTTAILLVSACSEKPVLELVEAQQVLASARDAEADLYAPEQYDLAVSNLENAIAAMDEQDEELMWNRNYNLAFDLFELSMEQSMAAIEIADSIRFESSFQAELLIPDVQETIDRAFAELELARDTSVVSRAQIATLDADLGFSAQLLNDARESFEAADYVAALEQAQQSMDLADTVRVRSEEINQLALEVQLELELRP